MRMNPIHSSCQRFLIFNSVGQPLHSSCNPQTGGCDLQNVNWVVRLIFPPRPPSTLYSDNVAVFPPSQSSRRGLELTNGFLAFSLKQCAAVRRGARLISTCLKSGLCLIDSPFLLSSLSSSSLTPALSLPRISCTLVHISALWTVTKAFWALTLYFFFALPLFDLC